jgi:hypothetical protein
MGHRSIPQSIPQLISQSLPLLQVLALLAAMASGSAFSQTQQVYRYIEPDGRIVYTDKPPPANAKGAQSKRVGGNTIDTSDLSYSSQLAQDRYPVTFYTFDCGEICQSAEGLLNKRGVPHTKVNVTDAAGAEQLKRLTGGLDAPVLQVGEDVSRGFNETKWQALLDQAGYPKTPAPRRTPAVVARTPGGADKTPAPKTVVAPDTAGTYPK